MATRGKDETLGFLSRWSERKRATEQAAAEPSEAALPEAGDAAAAGEQGAGEQGAVDPVDLPDIDTLGEGSDFTVFMRKGVPEALKRRALRKLWQVDPAFHHICMLDDYNLDYTDAATVVPNLKTIYQVGRGMVLPEDDEPEASQAQVAEAAPEPAPIGEGEAGAEAASPAPEEDAAAPARRSVRKPGTPLVPPAATRGSAEAGSGQREPVGSTGRPASASARRRRWGDVES